MKDDKKVPQLRFPEFTDAWKQRKFGEFVERKSDSALSSTSIPSVEYENVESETGVLKKDIYVKTEFKKGVLFSDKDVLYGKLRPYLHNWLAPSFTGVAVGDWWVLSPKNCSKDFLYRLLQTLTFDEIANQTSGTKMPRADWNLVSSTAFYIPSSIEEQAKIGSLFNRIDSTITLQQRKLNSLQKLKKGLLQKMFPKNGENIPEIRFPEFSDAWKQRELGEIAERVTRRNSSLESQTPLTISAEYGLIDQNKFFGKRIAAKDLSNYYLIQKGEFAYNKSTSNDAPWGAIKRLDCYNNGALSTLYIVFKIKDNKSCYSDFLVTYYGTSLWHKGVKEIASEGARNHGLLNVSPSDFFRTKLVIPQDFEEQRKIGAFFTQLDNTITLQQRKLESLQKLKKGLLQQMFI